MALGIYVCSTMNTCASTESWNGFTKLAEELKLKTSYHESNWEKETDYNSGFWRKI